MADRARQVCRRGCGVIAGNGQRPAAAGTECRFPLPGRCPTFPTQEPQARRAVVTGETMAGEAEVHVSQFLDEHGLGSFQIKLILWSPLIAMIDGYDIGAIAFAAPHLIAEWHIKPHDLGLVL